MTIEKFNFNNINSALNSSVNSENDFNLIVHECLPSTNDYILENLESTNLPNKSVAFAETQTAGKGRKGRQWHSVPGNILMSYYWMFSGDLNSLYGLSIVVGIALARVIKRNGLKDIALKWPNDLYWQNKKMGGILIETRANKSSGIDVVIGIGLNVVSMDEHADKIDQNVVGLESALQRKVDRDFLSAQILVELNYILDDFAKHGFNKFVDEWRDLDTMQGKTADNRDIKDKDFKTKCY